MTEENRLDPLVDENLKFDNMQNKGWLSKEAKRQIGSRLTRMERFNYYLDNIRYFFDTVPGFLVIPISIFLLDIVVASVPKWFSLSSIDIMQSYISILWQVHATITGIIFIAVFFITGALHGHRPFEASFWGSLRRMGLLPISSLMIGSLIGEGFTWFVIVVLSDVWIIPGMENLLISNSFFFLVTAFASVWLMSQTFKFLRSSKRQLIDMQLVRRLTGQVVLGELEDSIGRDVLSKHERELLIGPGHSANAIRIDTEKRGYVLDIHLGRLSKLGAEFRKLMKVNSDSPFSSYGSLQLILNTMVTSRNCTLAYISPGLDTPRIRKLLGNVYKIRTRPARKDPRSIEMFEALDEIYERTLNAIQIDNDEVVTETITLFDNMLETFLFWTKRFGKKYDLEMSKRHLEMIPRPYEAIFYRYRRLLFEAIKKPDSRSFTSLAYWPLDLFALAMANQDFLISGNAFNHMVYLYAEACRNNKNQPAIDHLIWLWRENLSGPEHYATLDIRQLVRDTGTTPEENRIYIDYLRQVYDGLYTLLGCAISFDDQNSFGHLLASLSTIMGDVLWDIDVPERSYPEDVKAHKRVFEEERATGLMYLSSIFFQFQHQRGNLLSFFKWFFKIVNDFFDNDFSVFTKIATKVCMAVHRGSYPSWFDTFCSVASLPEFMVDGRVRLQHYEEWPYWSYVIISSHYWQTGEIMPQNIDIPQERDIINILDILERNPERWYEVLGEKTLRNFRSSIDKTIKERKSA
jgi:hypothetical protein